MESAHASPQLPDGLERAQRGHRLVACLSDLSCHRLHFFLATIGDLTAAWNRLVGAVLGGRVGTAVALARLRQLGEDSVDFIFFRDPSN